MSTSAQHILFITKWYPSEEDPQMAIFVKRHAEAVSNYLNVTVLHVFSANVKVDKIDITQEGNLTTIRAAWPKTDNPLFKLKRMFSAAKLAVQWLRLNRPKVDVIHCHMLAQTAWISQQFYPSAPYIITEHWTGYVNGNFEKMAPLRKWMYKRLAQKASAITVVSDQLRRAMKDLGFKGEMEVVPNVVEVPDMAKEKNAVPHLLTIADFHEKNKNITGILKAIDHLKSDFNFHWDLIGDGEDREELELLSQQLGIMELVSFKGRMSQDQVHHAISQADLVVVNSRYETFSMVTLEAILMGVPVLATRSGGPENFINHENGFLIDPDDQDALEKKLIDFLREPQQFRSEKVKKSIDNIYDSKSVGKAFVNLYESILKYG